MKKSQVPVPIFYLILAVVLYGTWKLFEVLPIQEDVKLIGAIVVMSSEAYYLNQYFRA